MIYVILFLARRYEELDKLVRSNRTEWNEEGKFRTVQEMKGISRAIKVLSADIKEDPT